MISYFIDHPTAANVLMVALIVLGLVSLPQLQRDTFPTVAATEIEIRVPYPGATPGEVEEAVCTRIEEALDSVAELLELRCEAREDLAIAIAEMRQDAAMDDFFNDVKAEIEAISTFPEKVERSTIVELERTAVVASVAITGEMSDLHLRIYADQVKERIKRDSRIAQVRLRGFSDQEISIEVSAGALKRHGLSVSQVAALIESQSIDLPAGTMETEDGDLIVRFANQRRAPADFEKLVIASSAGGGRVLLGEVATISRGFEKAEDKILFNGHRAALLEISKTRSQDALRAMAALEENLERERLLAPAGVRLEISQDVTSNIRERLRILLSNGIAGLVLVFLTLWAFFGFRYSFWVAMGLPVSFLGAIFAMQVLGYTINMITMVALLVAIGLLMDDAIIISETVAARLQKGEPPAQAVRRGLRQVFPGVLSSFLTTVMIVGPLAFLSGRIGAVLRDLPVVLVITLLVSLIEAFLILPAHLKHSFEKMGSREGPSLQRWVEARFEALREGPFARLVDRSIANPNLTLAIIFTAVMVSFATLPAGLLKYQAFPELESDVIQARILLPQGTPLEMTEVIVDQVVVALESVDEQFSKRQPKGHRLVQNVTVLFGVNVDSFESGPHLATVSADLLPADLREGRLDELLDAWRSLVGSPPDVIEMSFTDQERGVAGKAIDIRLHAPKLERLKAASVELQDWLMGFPGVLEVSDDLRPGKPEIRISLREEASVLGISAAEVATELRAALQGGTDLDVLSGGESQEVKVRLEGRDRDDLDDLEFLSITSPQGQPVPLSVVAKIEQVRGFARIHRVDGQRTVTVQGTLDTRVANARDLMGMTRKHFLPEMKKRFEDVRFSFQGQGKESAQTGASLETGLLVGLVGVYLILCFQLRSYVEPLVIMLAIPTGIIGVVWGHLLLGLDLSMPSLVGLATLVGIVVNDSILLVAFIKERRKDGLEIVEAAGLAAKDRFRAIVLTSLTTVVGLLPLLVERSTQAQFLIPLVASVAFGLMTATVLSLFLVPSCFVVLTRLGWIAAEVSDATT